MTRSLAVAAAVLCLAGCFVFDNPFDISSEPAITFKVVVQGASLSGTYVWSASDNAFKTEIGGTPRFVYLDSTDGWCLATVIGFPNAFTSPAAFGALPPMNGVKWQPGGEITSVDDDAGGITAQSKNADSTVSVFDTLQVAFASSPHAAVMRYQWQGSSDWVMASPALLGTESTYYVPNGTYPWIRVVVTPIDGDGNIIGPPVVSPPVHLS